MKAIILCAGRGTRLKPLTDTIPKTLLPVQGEPILGHILRELPEDITEVFLVVGYLGEKIRDFVESKNYPFSINYIQQIPDKKGTGAALLSVKPFINKDERFLVLNGDDLIKKHDLENLLLHPRSFQVQHTVLPGYYKIVSKEGFLSHFEPQTDEEKEKGALVATGAYVLDSNFFDFEPREVWGGEIGIPQTLVAHTHDYLVTTVVCTSWKPINTIEHLKRANKNFSH